MGLKNLIQKEVQAFDIFNKDAKYLLITNLVYALAFPFIIIFGSAFVLRITNGDNTLTIVYNWGFFLGLIIGYYFNGLLIKRKFDIRKLFSVGMLLTVVPLSILMFIARDIGYFVVFYGILVGSGNGIYWSCRNIITYYTTNDENRNFFTSLEQFIIIFCNALIPLVFGTFILGYDINETYKINAYKITSAIIVVITTFAAFLIIKSKFQTPSITKFIYFRYGSIWSMQRLLTFTVGMVEAGFLVLMTLLILNIAGDEAVLGKVEFFAALISVVSIYIVGRIAKPHHRGKIMLAGAVSLICGSIVLLFTIENNANLLNLFTISFLGVIIMKVGQVIADPMVHSSFRSTFLTSIELSQKAEQRDSYAFVMDNEFFMNGGRIFGGAVFLGISTVWGDIGALKYTFLVLSTFQVASAFIVHKLSSTAKTELPLVSSK